MGRAIALEVIERDETLGAGRKRGCALVQRIEARLGREMALEPRDHRTRRGLSAFDDRLARIDGIHISAPHALAVDRLCRDAEVEMR